MSKRVCTQCGKTLNDEQSVRTALEVCLVDADGLQRVFLERVEIGSLHRTCASEQAEREAKRLKIKYKSHGAAAQVQTDIS